MFLILESLAETLGEEHILNEKVYVGFLPLGYGVCINYSKGTCTKFVNEGEAFTVSISVEVHKSDFLETQIDCFNLYDYFTNGLEIRTSNNVDAVFIDFDEFPVVERQGETFVGKFSILLSITRGEWNQL